MRAFTRQRRTPADDADWHAMRAADLTSTSVAALFGLSPYKTPWELWHEKREGKVVTLSDNERMFWGRELEPTIARVAAERNGWIIRAMNQYIRIPTARLGSSYDYEIIGHEDGPGILEAKNVAGHVYGADWHDDEAPPHIELQFQHELLVAGRHWGIIAALVGGNELVVLRREADEQIQQAIINEAHRFWESVEAGAEPTPDPDRDATGIIRMYQYAEPGKILDASDNEDLARQAREYAALKAEARDLGKRADSIKARILREIGDHEKVIGEGWKISAGVTAGAHVEYDRKPSRTFRVYLQKGEEE